jgi:hypothetical protein
MVTRDQEAQSRLGRTAAVGVGKGVDLGTGGEQKLGDVHGIRRRLLPFELDAVSRDVVEKRRLVVGSRTRMDELWVRVY